MAWGVDATNTQSAAAQTSAGISTGQKIFAAPAAAQGGSSLLREIALGVAIAVVAAFVTNMLRGRG